MYSRHRYRGSWYQSVFWLVVGILIGQFFRFDITLDSDRSQLPVQTQTAHLIEDKANA